MEACLKNVKWNMSVSATLYVGAEVGQDATGKDFQKKNITFMHKILAL